MSKQQRVALGFFVAVLMLGNACIFDGDEGEEVSPASGTLSEIPTASAAQNPPPTPETPTGAQIGVASLIYTLPFVWPADGPLTNVMGPEHPSGIDIGLDAGGSLAVRAAAGGTVLKAGGSEDEPLGLSVVIEHGKGIISVYGHLSAILVKEGDFVDTAQRIGTGGATGIADGVHLHFEVRENGQTVDPMDVLPTELPDVIAQDVDCGRSGISLPAGAQAQLDISDFLAPTEQIIEVVAVPLARGESFDGRAEDVGTVLLRTPLDFQGPDRSEPYRLEVTVDSSSGNRALVCRMSVQHRSIPTTFYVRADTEGDAQGHGVPAPEPTPTSTPIPTPTSSVEPHYSTPVVANPTTAAPTYSGPGANPPTFNSPPGSPQ